MTKEEIIDTMAKYHVIEDMVMKLLKDEEWDQFQGIYLNHDDIVAETVSYDAWAMKSEHLIHIGIDEIVEAMK